MLFRSFLHLHTTINVTEDLMLCLNAWSCLICCLTLLRSWPECHRSCSWPQRRPLYKARSSLHPSSPPLSPWMELPHCSCPTISWLVWEKRVTLTHGQKTKKHAKVVSNKKILNDMSIHSIASEEQVDKHHPDHQLTIWYTVWQMLSSQQSTCVTELLLQLCEYRVCANSLSLTSKTHSMQAKKSTANDWNILSPRGVKTLRWALWRQDTWHLDIRAEMHNECRWKEFVSYTLLQNILWKFIQKVLKCLRLSGLMQK